MKVIQGGNDQGHPATRRVGNFFHRHPERLISYIEAAIRLETAVLGVHIKQLAGLVAIPLEYQGEQALVPDDRFVCPKRFSNIATILKEAKETYSTRK